MRSISRSAVRSLSTILVSFVAIACSDHHDSPPGAGSPGSAGAGSGIPGGGVVQPGGYIIRPGTIPAFPGSGTSNAGDPLPNGMLCDSVPGADVPILPDPQVCYYDKNDPTQLAATLEQVLECVEGTDSVHIRLTFHPWFVDNTYGETAIGWDAREAMMPMMPMAGPMGMPVDMMGKPKPMAMPKPKMGKGGHTFKDLLGSDHAEITLKDGAGNVVLQFKEDYISEDPSSPSGYGSLGVTGGEGKVIVGNAASVVQWTTSIDINLNDRGYASYTENSPATDDKFTANADTPEWDYRVVYEAWIDIDAFGSAGFGGASIEFVHASPSKAQSNTLEVEPGDCPCNHGDPDETCGDTPPPDGGTTDPCLDNDPDTICGDSGVPPPPEDREIFCKEHPQDPTCSVD
jgi:hypothetical protein